MSFQQVGGNIPDPEQDPIRKLIFEFENLLREKTKNIPAKIIRAKLPGSVYIVRDPSKIIVAYAVRAGNDVQYIDHPTNVLPSHVLRELSMSLDIDDVDAISLPRYALDMEENQRKLAIWPALDDYIKRAVAKFEMNSGISVFSPIFGPNRYPVQDDLVFVLIPFTERFDLIYNSTVKPVIETDLNLVCRRADDIKSTNPIMKDIWKSICEARIILADLTDFNPNVMYELGIAHTLGKPSLLLHQSNSTSQNFPFDLAHIRRLNYEDSAAGGAKLRKDLPSFLRAMIKYEA